MDNRIIIYVSGQGVLEVVRVAKLPEAQRAQLRGKQARRQESRVNRWVKRQARPGCRHCTRWQLVDCQGMLGYLDFGM